MQEQKGLSGKWLLCAVCALLALAWAVPGLAQSAQCKVIRAAKVYASANTQSRVLAKLQKGDTVQVTAVKGGWAQVRSGAKTGYMAKRALKMGTKSTPSASGATTLRQVQQRLVQKGYLSSGSVTGASNAATTKAVRIFQMMNGLNVTGHANDSTVKKIMSSGAKRRRRISSATWARSGVNTRFRDGGYALLIDLATGARIRIRRVGGHNHLDVEPKTARDTATLKKVYGGTWSWNSRPALLVAGGRYYAAAMNGMPHGSQISTTNNFEGQFCVHLKGSTTHGTEKSNGYHQSNVNKVIAYFS